MAGRFNTFSRNSNNSQEDNEAWKANGFINFSLPSKSAKSGFRKLCFAGLKDSILADKELREWIEKDPEGACKAIAANIVVDYKSAEPKAGTGFDLDALKAA